MREDSGEIDREREREERREEVEIDYTLPHSLIGLLNDGVDHLAG